MSDTRVQQYQDHAGAEAVDSSGLEVKRLTFLEAVAMIVGTNIGAGVLIHGLRQPQGRLHAIAALAGGGRPVHHHFHALRLGNRPARAPTTS